LLKDYYLLTKPGIIRGNAITLAAGFFLASNKDVDLWLLFAVLGGSSLIIASGCVFNNYIDRDIDRKMTRTKQRALVLGKISGSNALFFATMLGVAGFATLYLWTNNLTVLVGIIGLFSYVVLYGVCKRKSIYGTLVGSISGAVPPVAGYTAVTGEIDAVAVILFFILVFWQMPHFYSIALYRKADYAAAGLPVLPVIKSARTTALHILIYIVLFIMASTALTIYGYSGYIYLGCMLVAGLFWLGYGLKGLKTTNPTSWARKMFFISLLIITLQSVLISSDALLP
jgi:protoheme IX farnesyltransferase